MQPSNQTPQIFTCRVYDKHHPVYVLGLSLEQISRMRSAYGKGAASYNVGFYDMLNYAKMVERVGIDPSVVVLAEHVQITGSVGEFLKRHRTPVLRVMQRPVPVSQLPPEYYYNGVYDTVAERDLFSPDSLRYHINLGVMIWDKNKESQERQTQEHKSDVVGSYDPRGTRFKKRVDVPKPEPEWSIFVRKYLSNIPARIVNSVPGLSSHEHSSVVL